MAFVSPSFCNLEAASIPTEPKNEGSAELLLSVLCFKGSTGLRKTSHSSRVFSMCHRPQLWTEFLVWCLSVGLSHYTFNIDVQYPSSQARGPIHFIACWFKYLLENTSSLKWWREFSCNSLMPKRVNRREMKPFRVFLILFQNLSCCDMWCVCVYVVYEYICVYIHICVYVCVPMYIYLVYAYACNICIITDNFIYEPSILNLRSINIYKHHDTIILLCTLTFINIGVQGKAKPSWHKMDSI